MSSGKGEDMKIWERIEKIKNNTYLSTQAGKIIGIAQRTVQAWTDYGLVIAKTAGTGDRRKYTATQIVELAVIKGLTDQKVPQQLIKKVMRQLRKGQAISRGLSHDHSRLVIFANPKEYRRDDGGMIKTLPEYLMVNWNEGKKIDQKEKNLILGYVMSGEAGAVLVFNLNDMVKDPVERM
jgi:DNA-binding transcriptional MerR regulator